MPLPAREPADDASQWLERWFKLGGQELPQEGQSWLAAMIAIGGMKGASSATWVSTWG